MPICHWFYIITAWMNDYCYQLTFAYLTYTLTESNCYGGNFVIAIYNKKMPMNNRLDHDYSLA